MAQEAKIIIGVEAQGADKTVKDIKDGLVGANREAKEFGDKTSQGMDKVAKSGTNLKTQLKNMKDELANLDQGSQEFKDLAMQAANLEDTIKDVDAQIRFLSSDTKNLDTGMQAIQGMAGGFQAAQGAAALFGSEQKEIQEALQKVIAVQGIMNGVQQVSNVLQRESILGSRLRTGEIVKWIKTSKAAIVVQKVFNAVLKANPIGLIITAVGLLVTGILLLTDSVKAVANWFVKLGEDIFLMYAPLLEFFGLVDSETSKQIIKGRQLAAEKKAQSEELSKQNTKRLAEIEERRKSEEKAFKAQQTEFDLEIERMEAEGKNANALRIAKQEAVIKEVQDQLKAIDEIRASWTRYYEEQAVLQGKSREEFIEVLKTQGIDVVALEEQLNAKKKELDQTLFSEESKLIKLKLDRAKGASKEEVDVEKKKTDDILKERKRLEAEAEELFNKRLEVVKRLNQGEKDEFQSKIDVLTEQYIAEQELFKFDLDTKAMLEQEYLDKVAEINRQAEEADLAEAKRIAEEKAKARIESIDKVEQTAMDVLSIAESLNNIVHGKELKRIKEKRAAGEQLTKSEIKRLKQEDRIRKAQALAQIAADTARGVSGAIAAGAGLVFPANLAAIASGVAAVLGGVSQAASILGESVDVGSVNTDTSSGGGSTEIEETRTPQLDPLGFGSSLLNQPQKVYVTEGDITGTQNKVSVIENQASFG